VSNATTHPRRGAWLRAGGSQRGLNEISHMWGTGSLLGNMRRQSQPLGNHAGLPLSFAGFNFISITQFQSIWREWPRQTKLTIDWDINLRVSLCQIWNEHYNYLPDSFSLMYFLPVNNLHRGTPKRVPPGSPCSGLTGRPPPC
jgi:hypothetical protein